MARLSTLPKGQWDQFERNLANVGLEAEDVIRFNDRPELLKDALSFARKQPPEWFHHGVFNPAYDVLEQVKLWCKVEEVFDRFSWPTIDSSPLFDPHDCETVVVLDVTLGTLESTFDFAWKYAAMPHPRKLRYQNVLSGPGDLALLHGIEFRPWTLRWARIKLDANSGGQPLDVMGLGRDKLPGCSLLFMAAQHPKRVSSMFTEHRLGLWLGGLKCGDRQSQIGQDQVTMLHTPYITYDHRLGRIELRSDWRDHTHPHLTIPMYRP